MEIVELLNKNLIKLDISSSTKEEAIKELGELMQKENKLNSYETYIEDVFNREKECTTGIGGGIAIPHGKSDGVVKSCIAIGKCKDIEWEALDDNPVKLIILIAVPKTGAQDEHLMILAKLAEMLMEEEFTKSLLEASSVEALYKLLA